MVQYVFCIPSLIAHSSGDEVEPQPLPLQNLWFTENHMEGEGRMLTYTNNKKWLKLIKKMTKRKLKEN